jgi:hypothetical protein
MRAYSASTQEALRARNLLKDWAGEAFLTDPQYQRMQQETVCDLRRTNIFLRLVLFLFTLILVAAAAGLLFLSFNSSHPSEPAIGAFLLVLAALCYAAAEFAVSQARLYRYGIEEALVACSVGFLCVGIQLAWFSAGSGIALPVPAAGAVISLWLWYRFGLPYASLAAMVFIVFLPGYWTPSHTAQHLIVAAFYAAGLITVIALRTRYRFTYLNHGYSIIEALLWLGIYLAVNLQLSSVDLLRHWWNGYPSNSEFSRTFYWTTFVLIWCLPPAILLRGLRGRDRFVIAVGAIAAVLTLVTNKPYLGWRPHSWDPMLFGALLISVALFIRRWLAAGPEEIRHGFTARRLSGNDQRWLNVAPAAFSFLSPQPIAAAPQPVSPHFSGGDSGGGGATSDF